MQNSKNDCESKTEAIDDGRVVGSMLAELQALRTWEQNLLCKKFDCEDGLLCKQLLRIVFWRKKEAASAFVQNLELIKCAVAKSAVCESLKGREQIWESVFRKIHNEEHAAKLLGIQAVRRVSPFHAVADKISDFAGGRRSTGVWYGAGAMITASILGASFFLNQPSTVSGGNKFDEPYVAPQMLPDVSAVSASDMAGMTPLVSSVSEGGPIHNRPASLDWLRSKGSVRFIEDGQQQLPILWVSPKHGKATARRNVALNNTDSSSVAFKRNRSLARRHQ